MSYTSKAVPILVSMLFMIQSINAQSTYKVYFLGGQSNMEGLGLVSELPNELKIVQPNVYIFHGNSSPDNSTLGGEGIWAKLRPGHGFGFSSNGNTNNYSDLFGVELSLAQRLNELEPNSNIALIKYARSGTSIDSAASMGFGCWEPDFQSKSGINQYDHFLATVRHALNEPDLDGDGKIDKLIPSGIVWMQGESDAAYNEEIALRYEANLKRLMGLIHAAFRMDDIPVVIGRITDSGEADDGKVWDYGDIVREAQKNFVEKDGNAILVTETDTYGYSDIAHYDSNGFIELGRRFAEALVSVHKSQLKISNPK